MDDKRHHRKTMDKKYRAIESRNEIPPMLKRDREKTLHILPTGRRKRIISAWGTMKRVQCTPIKRREERGLG